MAPTRNGEIVLSPLVAVAHRPSVELSNREQAAEGERVVHAAGLSPGDPQLNRVLEARLARDLVGEKGGLRR